MNLSRLKSWPLLKERADRFKNSNKQDSSFQKISTLNGIKFDLRNQLIDEDTVNDLIKLADEINIDEKIIFC